MGSLAGIVPKDTGTLHSLPRRRPVCRFLPWLFFALGSIPKTGGEGVAGSAEI